MRIISCGGPKKKIKSKTIDEKHNVAMEKCALLFGVMVKQKGMVFAPPPPPPPPLPPKKKKEKKILLFFFNSRRSCSRFRSI